MNYSMLMQSVGKFILLLLDVFVSSLYAKLS